MLAFLGTETIRYLRAQGPLGDECAVVARWESELPIGELGVGIVRLDNVCEIDHRKSISAELCGEPLNLADRGQRVPCSTLLRVRACYQVRCD